MFLIIFSRIGPSKLPTSSIMVQLQGQPQPAGSLDRLQVPPVVLSQLPPRRVHVVQQFDMDRYWAVAKLH